MYLPCKLNCHKHCQADKKMKVASDISDAIKLCADQNLKFFFEKKVKNFIFSKKLEKFGLWSWKKVENIIFSFLEEYNIVQKLPMYNPPRKKDQN